VAEEDRPEAVRQVDVYVAVDVPQLCTRGSHGGDRVDRLLPQETEARGGTGIGEVGAVLGGESLGAGRASGVALDEGVQRLFLLRGHPSVHPLGGRAVRAEGDVVRRGVRSRQCHGGCGTYGRRGSGRLHVLRRGTGTGRLHLPRRSIGTGTHTTDGLQLLAHDLQLAGHQPLHGAVSGSGRGAGRLPLRRRRCRHGRR
jgi:hypothetical protein